MKKVNNIIQIVKKSYDLLSDEFHNYFNQSFSQSMFQFSFTGGDISSYNHEALNKFIDHCVYYRLGISDNKPLPSEVIYDLSSTISPEQFEDSISSIFTELVYCAFPVKLTSKLQKQLEAHKIEPKVIDYIMNKLECESTN